MKKLLIIITAAFFAGMLFLSLFAESIHNASLPQVTVSRPEKRLFPFTYTDENGEERQGVSEKISVSAQMLQNGVYAVYSTEKNGTERRFVRLIQLETGEENDGYFEVVSGLGFSEKIVTSHTGELYDGCEVVLKQ